MSDKTFKAGDTLYWAQFSPNAEATRPCPVCFGKREVGVILGDDSVVTVPCESCGKGYEGPRGFVTTHEQIAKATRVTISSVSVTERADGTTEREYRVAIGDGGSHWLPRLSDLFTNEAEALARAEELAEQYRVDHETRAEYVKHNTLKSYSWNAGYHRREAKEAQRRLDYHTRMARICKARSRESEDAD